MLEIRQVQPQDFFSVLKIAYNTLPERYSPTIFNAFYESYPQGFLVADENKKVIGFIIGVKTLDDIIRIPMLAVTENYRRKNIGSKLIFKLLEIINRENINKIELEVKTNNLAAINFYKKHGFKIIERLTKFYQSGEDAYIMKRILHPY